MINSFFYIQIILLFFCTFFFVADGSSLSDTIALSRQQPEQPADLSVDSSLNRIYVTNDKVLGLVFVIDGFTNKVIDNITVGFYPTNIIVNSDTNNIYVSNRLPVNNSVFDTISIIDGSTKEVIQNIIKANLHAIDSNSNKFYITQQGTNFLSVLDGSTNKVIDRIEGFNNPYDMAINSNTGLIYLINNTRNDIFIVNSSTNKVIDKISLSPSIPIGIEVDSNTNIIYITTANPTSEAGEFVIPQGQVYIIDGSTNKVIDRIEGINNPYDTDINPTIKKLYVTDIFSNSLFVIDLSENKIDNEMRVGTFPISVDVNDTTNTTYVLNRFSGTISIIK